MKRWHVLATVAAATALCAPALVAQADPGSKPNGPYLIDQQTVKLNSLRSYEQLVGGLETIVARSGGAATLAWGPYESNLGRGIPVVEIGHGPTAVMIIAQQHGNEMETSDSVVALVRNLAGSSAQARELREKLTMVFVPRVNVDGFDGKTADGTPIVDERGFTVPWRQNYDPRFTSSPFPSFYTNGRGYDINRYHAFRPECPVDNPNWPNITTGVTSCETVDWQPGDDYDFRLGNPVPEAKTVRALFDRYQPAVTLDFHHQGTLRDADGRMVTGSTLWPTAVATADRLEAVDAGARERFDRGQLLARKVVSVLVDSTDSYGYANISRYPGGTEPGISRNAYGLLGSGSVLLELRGGIGQKSNGYIQKIGYQVGMSVLAELAVDPDLGHVSTATADGLVLGQGVPNEEESAEGTNE
ncbi:MAG TPA: M14 family zinc carboxypeptidase [Jiangellales bacterium]|nr:M14 family zinc carboxypeptidase [Jiangellales bacterium]